MARGQKDQAEESKAQTGELKSQIAQNELIVKDFEKQLWELEILFPNLPHESVPVGNGLEDNVILKTWGEPKKFDFEPKSHWDIATNLKLIDFERASKISGSGFACYTGLGARLQRALFNFMIDVQTLAKGYQEVYPPYMVKESAMFGTGAFPKFTGEYYQADEDLFLIPTAEASLTSLYTDEILGLDQLPIKLAAFSACFRREAGAAGKDTRGLLRMHQFDKVELFKCTVPEKSEEEHEKLTLDAESILESLGLHYQRVFLCDKDMSFQGHKNYDLELWSPGVGKFLEISSCTNFGDYQARRANLRFKRGQGEKTEFLHTINGSGLATPRLFAALIETYQNPNGTVNVPEVLRPYVGSPILE